MHLVLESDESEVYFALKISRRITRIFQVPAYYPDNVYI